MDSSKYLFSSIDYPHNRYNPLIDEWVLVCPHRSKRPWMGQVEKKTNGDDSKSSDPSKIASNPLAPGATRSSGQVNPTYTNTFVFDNDFPALIDDQQFGSIEEIEESDLFRIRPAKGRCRVICFHSDPKRSLPLMSKEEIIMVIDTWIDEYQKLGATYDWVQIFENKGAMMGCSNPHPHCQIWASRFLPNIPSKKHQTQMEYYERKQKPMLQDYVQQELKNEERVVIKNDHWVCLVPFWAVWPFETMILPHHRNIQRLNELNQKEKESLAEIMKCLLIKYDNLFETSFPYSMAWHGAPTGRYLTQKQTDHWTLHAVYYPPLLRSSTIKKFMVGYELAAQPQRDITPELAANILKEQSGHGHYSTK